MPVRGQPQLPSGGAFMSVIRGEDTSVMLKPVRYSNPKRRAKAMVSSFTGNMVMYLIGLLRSSGRGGALARKAAITPMSPEVVVQPPSRT